MRIVFYKSDGGAIVFFRKYNPYHDRRGRFASANGGAFLYSPSQIRYRNKKPSKQLTGPGKGDKIKSSQKVRLPDGTATQLTAGTTITKIRVFAGKGTNKPIRDVKRLRKTYGSPESEWKKVRGDGYIDINGESKHIELHWYESKKTGRVEMKMKRELP